MTISRPIPDADGIFATNIPSGESEQDSERLFDKTSGAAQPMHPNRDDVKTAATMANLIGTIMRFNIHPLGAVFPPEERADAALKVYPACRVGKAVRAVFR